MSVLLEMVSTDRHERACYITAQYVVVHAIAFYITSNAILFIAVSCVIDCADDWN